MGLLDSTGTYLTFLLDEDSFGAYMALTFFIIFILLAAMTVMNMLIGVLCEVVAGVAEAEKEDAAQSLMKQTVLLELKKFDDGDGEISEAELDEIMTTPDTVAVLDTMGIDVEFLQTLQVMTYE